jgi:putative transposase
MSSKIEPFVPGTVFHVYNRGNNRENLFKEDKNYDYFLSLVTKHILPIADLYAYCMLKNHFHFILRIKDIELLDDRFKTKPHLAFSNCFNAYAKAINKMYKRTGSLFQENIKRIPVTTTEYLIQLIAYVHLNPVKHKFSLDYKSFQHSSYHLYQNADSSFINYDHIMNLFGDYPTFEEWHDFNKLNLLNGLVD